MDQLTAFYFEKLPVRGSVVRLDETLREALMHQALPEVVRRHLSEFACATLLLAHRMAFDGSLVLQVKGDGPVSLMIAEVNRDLNVRATATVKPEATFTGHESFVDLVNTTGKGLCSLVADRTGRREDEPLYETAVAIEGATISEIITAFLMQTNQIASLMVAKSDATHAGALFLEEMPTEGGKAQDFDDDPDAFNRATRLALTVKDEELLGLDTEEILRRLFYEEAVRITTHIEPKAFCHCSTEAFKRVLKALGNDELEEIFATEGKITVSCRFCGREHTFYREDIFETPKKKPVIN